MSNESSEGTDFLIWKGTAGPLASRILHVADRPDTNQTYVSDRDDPVWPIGLICPALYGQPDLGHGRPAQDKPHLVMDLRITDPAGRPIQGAEVTFIGHRRGSADSQRSDHQGRVLLYVQAGEENEPARLTVEAPGFWGLVVSRPRLLPATSVMSQFNTIVLTPVSRPAMDSACWGLEAMGLDHVPNLSFLGARPVRVAWVTCAQVAGPKRGIRITTLTPETDEGLDDLSFASSARRAMDLPDPALSAAMTALLTAAPGLKLETLTLPRLARVSDMIAALDHCIQQGIDILCLSVATDRHNRILSQALRMVRQSGMVVLVPSNTDTGKSNCIGILPQTISVAALGRPRGLPASSIPLPLLAPPGATGFSALADIDKAARVSVVAPGLGVHPGPDVVSGTSVAMAYVGAFVARMLQSDRSLAALTRNHARAERLEAVLFAQCSDSGIGGRDQQGHGMPVWGAKGAYANCVHTERRMAQAAVEALDRLEATR